MKTLPEIFTPEVLKKVIDPLCRSSDLTERKVSFAYVNSYGDDQYGVLFFDYEGSPSKGTGFIKRGFCGLDLSMYRLFFQSSYLKNKKGYIRKDIKFAGGKIIK